MNYESICFQVIELAKQTGSFFLKEVNKVSAADVEEKGLHNFVSYVDKTAEERIVIALGAILPGSGFIAEEGTSTHRSEKFNWIIDPLDGTTNFLHRIPVFCVSIALMEGDELVLGVIYEPNYRECFYAWKGSAAYLNGNPVRVSAESNKSRSLLATGFPYYDYGRLPGYIELFRHFALTTSGLRRLGSAAMDLAWTACGRFEAFYEYGLQPWDVAAGVFIVQQAGGKTSDFHGGEDYLFSGELLASNGMLHGELLNDVMEHFK
jgi:myo-inositol-1(or 4)-monophosphatase